MPFLFQAFYYDLDKVRLLGMGWNVVNRGEMGDFLSDFLSAVLPNDSSGKSFLTSLSLSASLKSKSALWRDTSGNWSFTSAR